MSFECIHVTFLQHFLPQTQSPTLFLRLYYKCQAMRYTFLLLLLPVGVMAMQTEEKGRMNNWVNEEVAECYELTVCGERMEIATMPVAEVPEPLPMTLTQEIMVVPQTVNMVSVMPYTELCNVVSAWEGIYQQQRGATLQVRGGRPGEILYVIDGTRIDN